MNINVIDRENTSNSVPIDEYPDECPACHSAIIPNFCYAYYDKKEWIRNDCLQVIWKCPKLNCQKLFIAYYKCHNSNCGGFFLQNCLVINRTNRNFSQIIKKISESFCKIYNQSFFAEQNGLLEICGVGYRKSLEFLIKDYLIKLSPEKEEEIKSKFLGNCISEDIKNENIKSVAKRATWLGNDEAHYSRIWEEKELKDLKTLIDLVIHWFEMKKLTDDIIEDMPEKKDLKEIIN